MEFLLIAVVLGVSATIRYRVFSGWGRHPRQFCRQGPLAELVAGQVKAALDSRKVEKMKQAQRLLSETRTHVPNLDDEIPFLPPVGKTPMSADLAQFRDRLKVARRYLVGRIAEDDDPSRKFPDSGWLRILATLQTSLEAVEAVMAEDAKARGR